jgi:hypothetical protein
MSLSLTAIATEFDELPQKPNSDPRWLFRVSIFDALAGRGAIRPDLDKGYILRSGAPQRIRLAVRGRGVPVVGSKEIL